MKFTKAASLILSFAMAMSMAGCAESSTAQNDTASAADVQPISESAQWQFPDDPKDYTVDDYRHMVSINGITITLPTTINELKKLDDKFGYEIDYVYDGENQVLPDGGTGYDIFITYDRKKVCLTTFYSEPDEKLIPDAKLEFLCFTNEYTDKNVNVDLFNSIKSGLSIEQAHRIIGEPTDPVVGNVEFYEFVFDFYDVNIALGTDGNNEITGLYVCVKENNKNE